MTADVPCGGLQCHRLAGGGQGGEGGRVPQQIDYVGHNPRPAAVVFNDNRTAEGIGANLPHCIRRKKMQDDPVRQFVGAGSPFRKQARHE